MTNTVFDSCISAEGGAILNPQPWADGSYQRDLHEERRVPSARPSVPGQVLTVYASGKIRQGCLTA